jgi:pilus assembly protein Flp/PilA
MLDMFKRLIKEEEGQGMAEYGLILALVSVAVIAALGLIATSLKSKFNAVSTTLDAAH